ncbi:hypothetical protein [Pectobacterium atrosepticum]|uniref:hypothetical protein n=1 Tax=Pectobacterium atrosepticum TaxID=29471 RepID=UPI000CDD663D|nr:hypothetical protein [Pectobacterium atrosepticum]POW26073.1 hypothetical protein PB72LOC_03240 [Pectobacterium atrosepticum]
MKVQKIEIHVGNDDTKYFVLKSAEEYDYYLRCMQEYMGGRFHHSLEDDYYMEGVLKSIIENSKEGFNEFLKKHKYKASIKNVYFYEVLINLRNIHHVMSHCILHA